MENMTLPIDVVPNTKPPKFRWRQTVNGLDGRRVVVESEGTLPPGIELAVERMVTIVKQLLHDNAVLRGQVEGMAKRLPPTPPALPTKKSKG